MINPIAESLIHQLQLFHDFQMSACANLPTTLRGLVLKHGIGRIALHNRWRGVHRGRMKECFTNATQLALIDEDRWVYCEGYAARESLALSVGEHAWCLDRDNDCEVVDPTWRDTKGGAYLGIPFRTNYLIHRITTTRHYGLLDSPRADWPLLTLPPETWLHEDAAIMPRDFP